MNILNRELPSLDCIKETPRPETAIARLDIASQFPFRSAAEAEHQRIPMR